MADIQGRYAFGTSPEIYFNISYQTYRSGTTVYYRFAVGIEAIHSPSSFGYPIYCTISLNNSQVLGETVIKPNGTYTWDAMTKYYPSDTEWYSVTNTTGGTLPAIINIYPKYTTGGTAANGTVTVPAMPSAPSPPPITLSTTMARYDATIRIGATTDAPYIGWQYRKDNNDWEFLTYGTDRSILFCPANYGGTHGSVFQFRAVAQNADGQQSLPGDAVTFQCASAPREPSNLTASPNPCNIDDYILVTWSATDPVSGSLTSYSLQVRYKPPNTDQWTGYYIVADVGGNVTSYTTQPTDYNWFAVERGGYLQYALLAYNSYNISSTAATVMVPIRSGLINIRLNDGWRTDCPVYINPIDKPPNTLIPADVIYVADNDGHWRPNV